MALVNENYTNLKETYLFADIARKVNAFAAANPDKKIIRLGIGDVTLPLAACVVEAMEKAVKEMGVQATFRGYGPEQGYGFLHEALVKYYASFGVELASDEIFISDGAKSDCGNITDIFDNANTILIPDPVYPVYLDTNIMCGRKVIYMQGTPENNFLPMPDDNVKADVVYLCSPNNPTGAAYTKEQLEAWVAYARKSDAVILYDAAYEAFVSDPTIPRSIFCVEGAKECAIELCSCLKLQASPVPVAVTPLCPTLWYVKLLPAKKCTLIKCGSVVKPLNSTAFPTLSNVVQKLYSVKKALLNVVKTLLITKKTLAL